MLATAFLFSAHVVKWDAVRVDAVTLALLGFLIVIPLAELIRKIKLGEFEAEIGREEIAKVQARAATKLPPTSADAIAMSEERVLRPVETIVISTEPHCKGGSYGYIYSGPAY